ncbi:hypothetical protein EJB05_17853, partial [Eragrostis curvula]
MEGSVHLIRTADDVSASPKESGLVRNMETARREPAGSEIRSGGGDHRDGHRVGISLLPLKKRALNDHRSSSNPYGNSDDAYSPPPKMRRIDDCVRAEKKDADQGPAARAAAEKGKAVSDAVRWLNKGKWSAPVETTSVPPQPQPPPVAKLLHDGIRSFARANERSVHHAHRNAHAYDADEAADASTKTKQSNHTETRRIAAPGAEAVFSDGVRAQLEQLGATEPRFVHRKRLEKSDVCTNQNRLLISCKRESMAGCPITGCFSSAEMRRVEDKHVGLQVTALDRGGGRHTLTCKFLDSNSGYRFISGWGEFLKWNGLVLDGRGRWTRDVDVEIWAFRSRELRKQPALRPDGTLVKGKDGKPVEGGLEVDDHFHPDGSLGLLLLHREKGRRRVEDDDDDDEGDEPPMPVAPRREKKSNKQRDNKKRDASVSTSAGKEQGEAGAGATMSKVEMDAKFGVSTSNAVIGMMGLRDAMLRLRQRRENVERSVPPLNTLETETRSWHTTLFR